MSTTTRRNLLRIGTTAAVYAAGASIVTGGIALASQAKGAEPVNRVYARYQAAVDRFNNLPDSLEIDDEAGYRREEGDYHHALDDLVKAEPANVGELAVWFEAVANGDWWADMALEHMRRLAAQGAH